jgi:hypothetical protein
MNTNEQSLEHTIPLPPLEYQALVCGPNHTDLFEEARRWLVALLDYEGMHKSVYTAWDKQAGPLEVEDFTFPYTAEAFDACLLASVLTHLPPNEARHYLGELARVTGSSGKILLSIFFS